MQTENDPYNLHRFLEAQASIYDQVVAELRRGRKQSHWMWFVFPQMKGLGSSVTSEHFGIGSLQEAEAYLEHQILGYRLRECAGILLQHRNRTAEAILGYPDDLKLHSSMTLFDQASPDERLFHDVLERYFDGRPDAATLTKLKAANRR